MIESIVHALALLALFAASGIAACAYAAPRDARVPWSLVLAMGVATVVLFGAVLAWLGMFNALALAGFAVVAAAVSAFALRREELRRRFATLSWPGALLLGAPLLVLLAITPAWSFLTAPGMDAGNYEFYGNWIATHGAYVWDMSRLIDAGADRAWLLSRNTWDLSEDASIARPQYLYGYPTLLAVAKAGLGNPAASAAVNPVLAALVCLALFDLLRTLRIGRGWSLGTVAVIACSPVFGYYAKQSMSEMLALLGGSLVFLALASPGLQRLRALALASGMFLLLFTKLDALPFVGVMSLGIALATCVGAPATRLALGARDAIALGFAAAVTLGFVCLASPSSYLEHFSLPTLASGTASVAAYGLLLLAGYAGLALRPAVVARVPRLDGVLSGVAWTGSIAVAAIAAAVAVWCLALRPIGADPLLAHDAWNLQRLVWLAPAVPVLAYLLGALPALRQVRGVTLAQLLCALAGSTLFLVDSHHSAPDIWWSRRYLAFIVPGIVAISVFLAARVTERGARYAIGATALLGLAIQLPLTQAMLWQQVNPTARETFERLATATTDAGADAVVALEGGRAYAAQISALRSVFDGPVLLNVAPARIDEALAVLDARCPVLASSVPLARAGWRLLWSGEAELAWANTTADLLGSTPQRRRASQLHLYIQCNRTKDLP